MIDAEYMTGDGKQFATEQAAIAHANRVAFATGIIISVVKTTSVEHAKPMIDHKYPAEELPGLDLSNTQVALHHLRDAIVALAELAQSSREPPPPAREAQT